jgi:S-methylmethionine-dependent homocysteine/selenocysteine methylase
METIHRSELPQLNLFLTDGGLETTLIFHRGIDLPAFAAFGLLKDEQGTEEIRRYFESYLADLGARYTALRERLPNLNVVGGCCGTDDRHVAQICAAWLQPAA